MPVATKPDELVVMSWGGRWGRALLEAISRPFTQLTGIPVRHATHVGLKLPAVLLQALRSGTRPPFDVVWSNAVAAMRVAQAGGCELLDEESVPGLARLHPRARPLDDGEERWPMVSPYVVHYVMAYPAHAFPRGKPESWEVLLEPRFKEKIALYPGGNGFYPIAQVLGGGSVDDIPDEMSPCWSFLEKLRPQVGKLDYSIAMAELIARGELEICFRALTNAIAFRAEGLDVRWAVPREGITDTNDVLWIPRHLPEETAYWSRRYIAFALSREVQERWCEMLSTMPLHPGAALPTVFVQDWTLPRSPDDYDRVLHIADTLKVQHESEWEARFQTIFG